MTSRRASIRRPTLRALLEDGSPLVRGWCKVPSAFTAELMGWSGFDYVVVDGQHGLAGQETQLAMIQALNISRTPPLVRTSSTSPDPIMRHSMQAHKA